MRIGTIFLTVFIILLLGSTSVQAYKLFFVGNQDFTNQVGSHLKTVGVSRAERIGDLLKEMKEDVIFLANTSYVQDLFLIETAPSEFPAKLEVESKSRIISKEIENFLKIPPKLSLKELQDSEEFKNLVIKEVGEEGYTVLIDAETSEAILHVNPDFIGYDYDDIKGVGEEGVALLKEAQKTGEVSYGSYNWEEPDGRIEQKYGIFSSIPHETKDNRKLILATTTYLKDYNVIIEENISELSSNFLSNFFENKHYHNFLLISKEGDVIYMYNKEKDLGVNLELERNMKKGISKNYRLSKRKQDLAFYGPYIEHPEGGYLEFSVVLPIFDTDQEVLGYILLEKDTHEINHIIQEDFGLETEESYLVEINGFLASPLKHKDLDLLTQTIDTESSQECLEDLKEGRERGVSSENLDLEEKEELESDLRYFVDYKGEEVLGTDNPISQINWCLLTEVSQEEIIGIPQEKISKQSFFYSFIVLIILFSGVFVFTGLFNKHYIFMEKTSAELNKTFSWKFAEKLKLRYFGIFLAILFSFYVYLIGSLFFELNVLFLQIVSLEVFMAFIAGLIFFNGFKFKNYKSRIFSVIGGFLIILSGLFRIPMNAYWNLVSPFSIYYWAPLILLKFLGFMFLLFLVKEEVKING